MPTPQEVIQFLKEQQTRTVSAEVKPLDLEEAIAHLETLQVGEGQPFHSQPGKEREIASIRRHATSAYQLTWNGSLRIPAGVVLDNRVVVQGRDGTLDDIDTQPMAFYVRLKDWDRQYEGHPEDCEQSMLVFTV